LFENQSFSKPKIFIDIGAGSGVYSFYFAKRGYIVLSIDADKRNFEYIQRMNKIFKKKLILLPYVVSKKNGYSNFFLFRIPFIFISTLIPITSSSQSTEKLWKKLKVRTYTLDNLLKKLSITSRCNLLIKIDVEDMEYEVLLGMKKIIKLFYPLLCLKIAEEIF
jgi:FkbM family methyltransferase